MCPFIHVFGDPKLSVAYADGIVTEATSVCTAPPFITPDALFAAAARAILNVELIA
jgi:hypothetical protein